MPPAWPKSWELLPFNFIAVHFSIFSDHDPTMTESNPTASTNNTVLSCIQPTGDMHLGNYFGAVKNWVSLQDSGKYKTVYGVVDMHAMTMPYDPKKLKLNTENLVIDLLAAGLDPQKCTLFVQSLVPEHTELYWIFSCITPYGDLTRQTQFKDKSEQATERSDEFISAGLFTYPTLQAADILVYRAGLVPVGKDQEQHLELSRSLARRFNQTFGEELFPEPQVLSTETPKLCSLAAPEKKMSKSLGPKHYIGLFEEEASVRKKIRSAVTDSGNVTEGQLSPGVENLITLVRACGEPDLAAEMDTKYRGGETMYAPLKDATADVVVQVTNEMRTKREAIASDRKSVMKQVQEMSDDARDLASQTLKEVRRLAGLPKQFMFFQYPHRKALRDSS
jgi:tryptophanyl-tRNA synthetase